MVVVGTQVSKQTWGSRRKISKMSFLPADLRIFFAVEILAILLLGMQGPLIFTYFVEERGFAAHNFPYLMASMGTGAIIGALLLLRGTLRPTIQMILSLLIIDGVGLFCFVVTPCAPFLFVFMLVMGLISGVFFTTMSFFPSGPSKNSST